jgi:transcriptional regulator GlxA family with amidase domain
MVLRNVAVVVCDDFAPFELGVLCEAFGLDRSDQDLPVYDFAVVAVDEPPLRSVGGMVLDTPHRLDRLAEADLVCVPAWRRLHEPPPDELVQALRDAVARGARVLSVCSGAYVLAWAGLLDGLRATTHWRYAEDFARRFPQVTVDPDVLYVDNGAVITSAGSAAGLDACLHLLRLEHGSHAANTIARRMVVAPHRDGGQAQFVQSPVPTARRVGSEDLASVCDWVVAHPDADLSVEALAARACMSPRTFARRFREVTGETPARWVLSQRIACASELLEQGLGVEEVARRAGFGSAATLRTQFARWRGTSPSAYARTFRSAS